MYLLALLGMIKVQFQDLAWITVAQFVQFCNIASYFIARHRGAFSIGNIDGPADLLAASLPGQLSMRVLARLWHLTFETLAACYSDASAVLQNYGIPDDARHASAVEIPEFTFLPPAESCIMLRCKKPRDKKLDKKSVLAAYLYDLDGLHSAHHISQYCDGKSFIIFNVKKGSYTDSLCIPQSSKDAM